ncbi:membrane protein [Mycolicibacter heraklionensis]|uniref:Membrane protein n=1 Tax=Mycolicibacter heraklionensis TaxID=512402 RepID=A0ABR5FHI8_9MYCO|nr:DMT family transporter [Mycolicibacter heraklionensis]KLO30051.1 membrane protein [Mycolicibacter heraklionensis]
MAKETVAVLLALGAALFSAISDVIQQRSAHRVGDQGIGAAALFARLLTDRRWWVGTMSGLVGLGLQAVALGLGSVLLVESVLVTSLLFALPLGARQAGRRLGRSVWLWSALLVAAESIIITVGHPTAGQARASLESWVWVVAVLAPTVLLCLIGARAYAGRAAAAVLLAAVSAISWGIFAVLTKGVVDLIGHGPRALLAAPELYAWGAVALAGAVYQQSSFRAGSLTASLPTITVLEPMVAATLGMVLLGEVLKPGRDAVFTLALAVATLVAAVAALSRDQAATAGDPAVAAA